MLSINRNWALKQMTQTGTTSVEISILAPQAQSLKQPGVDPADFFFTCRVFLGCCYIIDCLMSPVFSPLEADAARY